MISLDQLSRAPWLRIARGEIGVLEVGGDGNSPRVLAYLATCRGERSMLQRDKTPWCSAFVNWCMQQAQFPRTHSLAARSWLRYGRPLDDMRAGAIAVLWRGLKLPKSVVNAPGHVGFVHHWDDGFVWLLGGNQLNQVGIHRFPRSRVLDLRWPTEAR